MKIGPKKVVTLTYVLRTDGFDGTVVETATVDEPLQFIFGIGMMLPAFEANLEGLEEGDTFEFKLDSKDAYGERSDENIIDIPIDAFRDERGQVRQDLLKVGNVIPLQDMNGNQYFGEIIDIKTDSVKMDFNHPMAGQDLYFTGKVIGVRDATEEELAHGHVH